jgi:hypothetical protein
VCGLQLFIHSGQERRNVGQGEQTHTDTSYDNRHSHAARHRLRPCAFTPRTAPSPPWVPAPGLLQAALLCRPAGAAHPPDCHHRHRRHHPSTGSLRRPASSFSPAARQRRQPASGRPRSCGGMRARAAQARRRFVRGEAGRGGAGRGGRGGRGGFSVQMVGQRTKRGVQPAAW